MFDRKELKSKAREQINGNIWLYFGLSIVFGLILSASSFTAVAPLVLTGPLELGLTLFMLQVVRNGKGEFATGFKGFNQFLPAFTGSLLAAIFTLLWCLLLVIPGIIATYRYSMLYYIIADNPELSGPAALNKSKEMMVGHKWELFVLHLSFIPWGLLCIVTFGLAGIYVIPYIDATVTNFYEQLKSDNQ